MKNKFNKILKKNLEIPTNYTTQTSQLPYVQYISRHLNVTYAQAQQNNINLHKSKKIGFMKTEKHLTSIS